MSELNKHPVLEEIERRQRGDSPQLKLALAIEGGGIRSTVTAGQGCGLESSGIEATTFDAVFGSSGGAYVGGYYLTGRMKSGATVFYENNRGGEFIDFRQLVLRRRPVVSLDHILDLVCSDLKPIGYQEIVDTQKLHVLATRVSDFQRHIFPPASSVDELKNQLRAGSTIPAAAGNPVEIDGEKYLDAALSEPVPYLAAIDSNYDAVLVLSSRPNSVTNTSKSDIKRKLTSLALLSEVKKIKPGIIDFLKERAVSDSRRLAELREMTLHPKEPPYVFAIHPSDESPLVKQLEKKPSKVIAGTMAGYLAVKAALNDPIPLRFRTEAEFYGIYDR